MVDRNPIISAVQMVAFGVMMVYFRKALAAKINNPLGGRNSLTDNEVNSYGYAEKICLWGGVLGIVAGVVKFLSYALS